jgi:WD40 repeat protein
MSIAQAHDQLVGRSLGEFVLRERIGEGGFGAVYRATQPALDREAVVKVLHGRLHASKAATDRFLREAKLASKLDHPYAAHIYAFGAEPDGELWIAMELVRGTPLDRILRSQGPLALERFLPLLDRICEVVHTAHEQGIVHRDLKPANVMVLARAGRLLPKLLDFGIAKGVADPSDALDSHEPPQLGEVEATSDTVASTTQTSPDLTQRGAIIGSPPYMAPEQWVDAGRVDTRTDLYALGILAYECLTGQPPFTGGTMTMIAYEHAMSPPPPLGPRFPAALDAVFAKVLAKQSAERYGNAIVFATAFRQAAGIAPELVTLPSLDPTVRDATVHAAPQPIAEAIAGLEAARNAHQARDAIVQAARTIARYLGLLALVCRSRVSAGDEPVAITGALRTVYRRSLTEVEWLELGRMLTSPWLDRRDAYPIPELVDALHDPAVTTALEALLALRDREAPAQDALVQLLGKAVPQLGGVLDALAFVRDYAFVVTVRDGIAERWTGARRPQRTTTAVRGKGLAAGVPALLDSEGVPVLTLAPLFQVAAPSPGAPAEMFVFEGRDARGAKLVALPAGFEHHDDALWGWFRALLSDTIDETSSAVAEEKPPYRGLSAFSADDGAQFVGREKLVDAFSNRLKLQPLLAVVGRSGAGKSSFVHAGVVPAMPAGWRAITMRPGASPLGALIARLEHAGFPPVTRATIASRKDALGELLRGDAAQRGPVLLVIDQLEEMFTLCDDADERRAFAEAIAAAARTAEDPVRVIFTLRDDFLVRTEQVPAMRNRIGQGLQLLAVPVADDLLRILVEPSRRVGYEFEDPALPREMVDEVADQPGALALISFTAQKLWELRDRHFKQLTRSAYRTLGGVGGALARHADVTLDEMPPEARALARDAFRHLVTTQNTRAVLTRKDLCELLGASDHADQVIEKLVAARLLVASENESGAETIEIVHEALLVTWPRLVEWRREDAAGARFREQLRTAARQWDERGRAKGLLWRGDAVADYARWRAAHDVPLTEVEAAFADSSLADAARGRRNRRALLATAFASLVAVVVGLVVFNASIDGQRARAEQAARDLHDHLRRQYEDQGRRLVLAGDPLQALAYLAKAADAGEHDRAHQFLVAEAVRATEGELVEVRHDNSVRSPHFSSDGTRLVTAGFDKQARIWDARTGDLLLSLPHPDAVNRATFSPDDTTVLTGGVDGTTIVWDARTGAKRLAIPHTGYVWCSLYTSDGQLVLTGGDDDVLAATELATGQERWRVHGGGAEFKACALSRDSGVLAAGDTAGVTRMWDVRTGKLVRELRDQRAMIWSVTFSADGARLLAASADGTAVLWDAATGARLQTFAHEAPVLGAELSPDGHEVITASGDRTAVVWDATTGKRRLVLAGHAAAVKAAKFSPDGRYVVTTSEDASAQLWDASDGRAVARWRGHRDAIWDPAFDPSGTRLVTAGDDGAAIVWSVAPQERVRWLVRKGPLVTDAQFSPDGTRVVTASQTGLRVWDAASGTALGTLGAGQLSLVTAFSPDGYRIAASGGGSVRVYDVASSQLAMTLGGSTASIEALAWSPDGRTIVAGNNDGVVRGWNAADGKVRFEHKVGSRLYAIAFFPAADRFLTTGEDLVTRLWRLDGTIESERRDPDIPLSVDIDASGQHVLSAVSRQSAKVWNAATGATERLLVGHVGGLVNATWSPDGTLAVTASFDATARIWATDTGQLLAILSDSGPIYVARFSPDGRRILLVNESGGVAIHELPRLDDAAARLERLAPCLPFQWAGEELEPVTRDLRSCAPR